MSNPRILVIKLSALGDFVQACGPFAAIRAHHADADITVLTTRPYAEFAVASPYFDHVWIDDKPKIWQVAKVLELRRRLAGGHFKRVYDLQTSDRSSSYFKMMGKVEWSGIASGCSLPHDNPDRDVMHTIDRQAEQLRMAGIESTPLPDLSWVKGDPHRFGLARPYVLLCPGGAPHRPGKRWPAGHFAALARWLAARGITPVVLGTINEKDEIKAITESCPQAVGLAGRTSFLDVVALARDALAAVGNDTGPMHLVAAAPCPALVLFSHDSDPALCAPRGKVSILRVPDLAMLTVPEVEAALAGLIG